MVADVVGQVEQSREDAHHIAIDGWRGDIKGDAADGAGGVRSDARQGLQRLGLRRETPGMAVDDDFGAAMQVAGAAVITQAFPELQHGIQRRGSQCLDRGHGGDEALVIWDDGIDLGLLQHDLRQPDAVGIAVAAPGSVGSIVLIPGEQLIAEGRAH